MSIPLVEFSDDTKISVLPILQPLGGKFHGYHILHGAIRFIKLDGRSMGEVMEGCPAVYSSLMHSSYSFSLSIIHLERCLPPETDCLTRRPLDAHEMSYLSIHRVWYATGVGFTISPPKLTPHLTAQADGHKSKYPFRTRLAANSSRHSAIPVAPGIIFGPIP